MTNYLALISMWLASQMGAQPTYIGQNLSSQGFVCKPYHHSSKRNCPNNNTYQHLHREIPLENNKLASIFYDKSNTNNKPPNKYSSMHHHHPNNPSTPCKKQHNPLITHTNSSYIPLGAPMVKAINFEWEDIKNSLKVLVDTKVHNIA